MKKMKYKFNHSSRDILFFVTLSRDSLIVFVKLRNTIDYFSVVLMVVYKHTH